MRRKTKEDKQVYDDSSQAMLVISLTHAGLKFYENIRVKLQGEE